MGVPIFIEGDFMLLEGSVRLWGVERRFVCFELFSARRQFLLEERIHRVIWRAYAVDMQSYRTIGVFQC